MWPKYVCLCKNSSAHSSSFSATISATINERALVCERAGRLRRSICVSSVEVGACFCFAQNDDGSTKECVSADAISTITTYLWGEGGGRVFSGLCVPLLPSAK